MPRPKKMRLVTEYPIMSGYLPENMQPTGTVELSVEGMEAIRLSDLEGLAHEAASLQMGISRQTYGRVLAEARKIVAEALVTGKRICFGGGMYSLHEGHRRRHQRGHHQNYQVIVQPTLERLNEEYSTGEHIMPQETNSGGNNSSPKDNEQEKQNKKKSNKGCTPGGQGLGRGGGQGRRDGSGGGRGRGGGGKGGRRNQS